MTFTTLAFLLFLPIVLCGYWLLSERRLQNVFLIAASYIFYGWWDWRFCALLLGSSLVDFLIAAALGRTDAPGRRRQLLILSLVSNLGVLCIFKYSGFFLENVVTAAAELGWSLNPVTLNIVLPVGISFYTFQTLSYTIDIYQRRLQPARSLSDYLAFVSFFPQLVAGPIERAIDLVPQFAEPRTKPQYADCVDASRRVLWGFFKKLVIADNLATIVDAAYNNVAGTSGPMLAIATVCFAFQIYADFSAYSDIAIGVARLFGIRLQRNFAYPYFSQSVAEFWRRWHISLSSWFRDYVYIPLGGSTGTKLARWRNTLVTFLLSGFWHGAAWTYLFWGGVNGAAIVAPSWKTQRPLKVSDTPGGERNFPTLSTSLRIGLTFTLICFTWILFRASSLSDALSVTAKIGRDLFSPEALRATQASIAADWATAGTLVGLALFVLFEWCQRRHECPLSLDRWPEPLRWTAYSSMLWILFLFGHFGDTQFIYFVF